MMDGKMPELSGNQWEFLSLLDALAGPVSADIVGELCPLSPSQWLDLLEKGTQMNLIRKTDENELSLAPDIPDLIRESLPQFLHPGRLSAMIETLKTADRAYSLPPEILANLLSRSGRKEEAARLKIDIAQSCVEKQDHFRALQFFQQGIQQLGSHLISHENRVAYVLASLEYSNLSLSLGRHFIQVEQTLERAKGISERLGDRRSRALIDLHLGRILFLVNRQDKAIEAFAHGERQVRDLGDDHMMDEAAEFLALYYFMQGRFKSAMEYFERAVGSFESRGKTKLTSPSAPIWMGLNAAYLGQFHHAIGMLDFLWRHAKRESHLDLASTIRAVLGMVLLLSGNKREGVFHLQLAEKESGPNDNFLAKFFSGAGLAYYHFIEGRMKEVRDLSVQLTGGAEKEGMMGHFSSPWILEMARGMEGAGYGPLSGFSYEELLAQSLRGSNIHLRGVALRLRAKDAFLQGKPMKQIEMDLTMSEGLLKESGNPFELAKTRIEMAILSLTRGDRTTASTLAQKARQGLSGPLDVFFPDSLRSLLEEEGPGTDTRNYNGQLIELLLQMTEGMIGRPSIRHSMNLLVSAVNRFLGAERGCLFWSDDGKAPGLALQATRHLSKDEVQSAGFSPNRALILKSFASNKPILVRAKRAIVCLPLNMGKLGRGVLFHDNSYLPDCFDFLDEKMLSDLSDQIVTFIKRIWEYARLMKKERQATLEKSAPGRPTDEGEIQFRSPIMASVLEQADVVARSEATVHIQGETGVGKELLARRLHAKSPRHAGPFITIDPASIPESLLESELFGHEKGSFTGADRQKPGRIELAHKGTLFIDEIGEIPESIQIKLLRVLQEKEVVRIGGRRPIRSDFRLLAATNRELWKEVEEGRFRKDLYYRINVVQLRLPPLRERREDIVLLAEQFLGHYRKKNNTPNLNLTGEDKARLIAYDWPGNVRELKNVMERASILQTLDGFDSQTTSRHTPRAYNPFGDIPSLDEVQRRYIDYILEKTGGRIAGLGGAAQILGMKRTTLYSRMKKLGLS